VSRTSRVPYHQNAYDLLGVVGWQQFGGPTAEIARWEHRTGHKFPPAMTEFYTTSVTLRLGGEEPRDLTLTLPELWSEYSNDERANSTEEVLRHSDRPWRVREEVEPGPYFRVMTENQGNWAMYLRASGDDDPPAYVTNGELYFLCPPELYRENLGWCRLGQFTDVLFDWLSYYYLETSWVPLHFNGYQANPELRRLAPPRRHKNGLWFRTPAEPFAPPVIDYLIEQLDEPERTPRPGNVTTYTFRPPGGIIRVTADEPGLAGALSAWWIHADMPERLAELARLVLPFGTLRETLRADTGAAREVLREIAGR
jgi:hypothetical protein